jgi:hypothetical protein
MANVAAWFSDIEQGLKIVLLLVSIGYGLDRWICFHFKSNRKNDE